MGVPGSVLVDFLPLGDLFSAFRRNKESSCSDFPVSAAFLPPGLVDAALVAERPWIQQGARRRRPIWTAGLEETTPPPCWSSSCNSWGADYDLGTKGLGLLRGRQGGRPGFLLTHRYLHRSRVSERPPESESSLPRLSLRTL